VNGHRQLHTAACNEAGGQRDPAPFSCSQAAFRVLRQTSAVATAKVLVVDDEPSVRDALVFGLIAAARYRRG
jgi:hypothetical protein